MPFSLRVTDKNYARKVKIYFSLLALFLLFVNPAISQTISKKKGKVTTTYANGKTESSGKVKNYKKQGTWKYWSETGELEKTITYKDDLKDGLYTEYVSGGKKSVEGHYSIDHKTGTWNSWYTNGKLSSKLNYTPLSLNGFYNFQDGIQQYFYEDGQLREQSNYVKFKIEYKWTWYRNGRKRAVEYYENGKPDGTWRTYPDPSEATDTLPSSIDNFSNGKREGLHSAYSHGRLSEEIYYKNDKLEGSYKKWDSNGLLGISENYKNGLLEGLCKYFNYGKCIREATYSEGKIIGEEKEYDSKGGITRSTWYTQGIIDSAKTFHSNGKIATYRVYRYYLGFVRTEEFSSYSEWDSQGILLLKGTYHFESKDKEWTTYYPDLKIKSITPYAGGKIKGIYKKWYANGKRLIELDCDGNSVMSTPKIWDEKGNPLKPGTKKFDELLDSSKPGEIYNDPKKYRENRPAQPDRLPTKEENKKATGGRGGTMETSAKNQECASPVDLYDKEQVGNDEWTQTTMSDDTNQVFQTADKMAEFPGGRDSLMKFLQRNIVYPVMSKDQGIQGKVYASFIVERDGSLTNITILKPVQGAPELSNETIRVIKKMPKWMPGTTNGKLVRVKYVLPVNFVIQ